MKKVFTLIIFFMLLAGSISIFGKNNSLLKEKKHLSSALSDNNSPPLIWCKNVNLNLSDGCEVPTPPIADFIYRAIDPDGDPLTFSITPDKSVFGYGTHLITVSADDGTSVSSCTSYLTVRDPVPPSVSCLYPSETDPLIIKLNGSSQLISPEQLASFSDNCEVRAISMSKETVTCRDAWYADRIYPVTIRVIDRSLNLAQCTSYIKVKDVSAPVLTCKYPSEADPYIVELTPSQPFKTSLQALNIVSYSDNCAGSTVVTVTLSKTQIDCSDIGGPFPVTIEATDRAGNASTPCVSYVQVKDVTPPRVSCRYPDKMEPLIVKLYSSSRSLNNDEIIRIAGDNCSPISIKLSQTSVDCKDVDKMLAITATVEDEYEYTGSCVSYIIVKDASLPYLNCKNPSSASPLIINLTEGSETLDPAQLADYSDNCSTPSVSLSRTSVDCDDNNKTLPITVEAKDDAGNLRSCVTYVRVWDNTPPTISCKYPTSSEPYILPVTGSFTSVPISKLATYYDNCGLSYFSSSLNYFYGCYSINKTHPIRITVQDKNRYSSSCVSYVKLVDNTPPRLDCQDVTVTLDQNGLGDLNTEEVLGYSYDNCGTINILSVSQSNFNCSHAGTQSVSLTVDDGNGNGASCTVAVGVENPYPPELEIISQPIVLWPPNHKYHTVSVSDLVLSVKDNCNILGIEDVKISKVSSDELEDAVGDGDGNTLEDIVIAADCNSVKLRSERQGSGNGRVYTLHLNLEDGSEVVATATVEVHVPHDNGNTENDGPIYTVNGCNGNASLRTVNPNNRAEIKNHSVSAQLKSFPNPFNERITFQFTLGKAEKAALNIFDFQGSLVKSLLTEPLDTGEYTLEWNGKNNLGQDLPAGIYFVRLQHSLGMEVLKIIKIR